MTDDMHPDDPTPPDDEHRRAVQRALDGVRAPDALRRAVEQAVAEAPPCASAPRVARRGCAPARRGRAGVRRRGAAGRARDRLVAAATPASRRRCATSPAWRCARPRRPPGRAAGRETARRPLRPVRLPDLDARRLARDRRAHRQDRRPRAAHRLLRRPRRPAPRLHDRRRRAAVRRPPRRAPRRATVGPAPRRRRRRRLAQSGRTCILASRDVPLAQLVTLAGYAA